MRKDRRLCLTEAVYALLDIANHKSVLSAYQSEDSVLYLVYVLIFVDVYLVKAIRESFCILGRFTVLTDEQ